MGAKPRRRREPAVLALPKGRVLKQCVARFAAAGYDLSPVLENTRKLTIDCGGVRVLVVRNSDVPIYVAHGAADLGVAGGDVLDELGLDLFEPLDLGIGRCRLVVAEPSARPVDERSHMHLRIATKYPRATHRYLQDRGLTAEVIKLSGSIELAPLIGLADRIVDLVETGETMRQNGLVEVETIAQVSSRLIANPARLKLYGERLRPLIDALDASSPAG